MPEVRSGVRRARAPVVEKKKVGRPNKRSEHLIGNYVKTRAAAAREAAAAVVEPKQQQKKPRRQTKKTKEGLTTKPVIVISEPKEDKHDTHEKEEEIGKVAMADASGGLSAN